ncbi:MAG: cytochrome c biogenesis protein CcsA [Candidatus Methylacidiphilales bacterium]|nr:cytochrome c biogenesis protein CcsA [Candidatus Methylacidiphilales bacterium]
MKTNILSPIGLLLCLALSAPAADSARPSLPSSLPLRVLEEMPIQHGGRKKPLFAYAVDQWRAISGSTHWEDPAGEGGRWTAMQVVVDAWLHPERWTSRPVILMDYIPLKKALGYTGNDLDRRHFSFEELTSNKLLASMAAEAAAVRRKNAQATLTRDQQAANQVAGRINLMEEILSGSAFRWIPDPKKREGTWATLENAGDHYPLETLRPLMESFQALVRAYDGTDAVQWESSVRDFEARVAGLSPEHYPTAGIIHLEWLYKKGRPVTWAWIVYVLAFVVLVATPSWGRHLGYGAGWLLAGLGMLLQTSGLVLRVLVSGRPPVTNMYETVIWVAYIVVVTALVFELIYRGRYFLLGALPVAVLSLILADTQPTILDGSIQPLVPVLRHNFWLVVHVLTIVSSYAPLALALGVSHIALGKLILGRKVEPQLHQYIYRCLQIGVFLIGTGTILGGVWANYSWGRFWGWDPKETWALIAFLCYLAILHGRIAGWWGGFGLAVGSILAFQSVVMAWYGVNFILGKGLHSYGFGTGGFPMVAGFVLLEAAFLGLAFWCRYSRSRAGNLAD